MAAGIYFKLATNVPYDVLTNFCYYLSGSKSSVAILVSDWLTYKKLIISVCFKFLSEIYKFLIETQVSDTGPLVLNKASNYVTLGLFILHVFYFIVERIEEYSSNFATPDFYVLSVL